MAAQFAPVRRFPRFRFAVLCLDLLPASELIVLLPAFLAGLLGNFGCSIREFLLCSLRSYLIGASPCGPGSSRLALLGPDGLNRSDP
jgi:hypothetical protein